jgi:hypothetical protein
MRAKSGIEALDEASGRAPKPGVAGSNPAGGTLNLLASSTLVSLSRPVVEWIVAFELLTFAKPDPAASLGISAVPVVGIAKPFPGHDPGVRLPKRDEVRGGGQRHESTVNRGSDNPGRTDQTESPGSATGRPPRRLWESGRSSSPYDLVVTIEDWGIGTHPRPLKKRAARKSGGTWWPAGERVVASDGLRYVLARSGRWHARIALEQFASPDLDEMLQAAISTGTAVELIAKAYLASVRRHCSPFGAIETHCCCLAAGASMSRTPPRACEDPGRRSTPARQTPPSGATG